MKSAKKLLLLVLSLVLLIGVFAVAAFAEDAAGSATVVYPDGTVDTYTAAGPITPSIEAVNGLYYGKGNTLYKDDATEGWIYTDTNGNQVTEITEDMLAAGTFITASGFDKVYYVTEEKISTSAPAVTVYHLVDNVDKYMSSSNKGDRGDGTNTGASSRDVLGNKATDYVKICLYEDVITSQFNMIMMPSARQHVGIPTYLDLNGHSVTNNYAESTTELKGAKLYIFSSKPGANWIQPNTTNAFYASDDGTFYFGNNSANNATYSDNISFFAKSFFHGHWGGGAYIYGGHFYQLPGASIHGSISIARRVEVVQNASFYVLPGYSVFSVESATEYYKIGNGGTVNNCKFYGTDASSILTSTQKSNMVFENCTFYGLKGTFSGSGEVSLTAKSIKDGGTNTFLDPIAYKTVTWLDGTTTSYYAESLEAAKLFVENHPKIKQPLFYEVKKDGELFMVYNSSINVAYDDNLNATVTRTGGIPVKVYYTITYSNGTVEYYTGTDYQTKLSSVVFKAFPSSATITLYADVSYASGSMVSAVNGGKAYLDLNGHLWTLTGSGTPVVDIGPTSGKGISLYIYSSTPGGKIYAPSAGYLFRTNSYGTLYLGERDTSKVEYGANLTVETTRVNGDLYGGGMGIYGGTYVQVAKSAYNYMFTLSRLNEASGQFFAMKNATFVLNKANSSAIHWINAGFGNITNCTFVGNASGATPIRNATTKSVAATKTPTFDNCKFINVNPTASLLGDKYPIYRNCVFSLTEAITTPVYADGTTTTPLYLAKIQETESITYGGASYSINYALLTEDSFLTVAWLDGTHPYWGLGTSPISETPMANEVTKQQDGTYVAIYDRFYYPAGITKVAEANLGTTVSDLSNVEGRTLVTAFSYQVEGGFTQYAPLLETPAENGEQFVSLLNNLSDVKIVMYTDIDLASGVLFGTLVDAKDVKGKDTKKIDQSGDVDWDLNGFVVTVLENATPITMSNYSESEGSKDLSVLHFIANGTFKLYSSVPGGQYINNSTTSIFGALKYADKAASYILGTSDLAVNGGDNLTIVSTARILIGHENNASGPAGVLLGINGGTYVYKSNIAAFICGGKIQVSNAKILTTGSALSVFICSFWAGQQGFSIENSTVVAASPATLLVEEGYTDGLSTSGCKVQHTVTIKDVTFAGGNLEAGYSNGKCTFVFQGDIKAPSVADLSAAYASAPEGKTVAYSSVSLYGTAAKFAGYYESPTIVNVQNTAFGTVEPWLVGSAYISPAVDPNANVVIEDGKYFYRPNPIWVATVNGVIVEDVCAAENAGATVVLAVGGDIYRLFFTVTVNGVVTYYYNADTASADLGAVLTPAGAYTYEIKLYNDIVTPVKTIGRDDVKGGADYTSTYKIDANGYTLSFKKTTVEKASYILHKNTFIYWYSTVEGGAFDFGDCLQIACSDSSGQGYFGEPVNDGSTTYGKNVTFYFDALHGYMYSSGLSFIGGTYIQVENSASSEMFNGTNLSYPTLIRNCTFFFKKAGAIFYGASFGNGNKIINCNFICEEPTDLFRSWKSDKATTFENCNFYNVNCKALGVAVNYENCNFSLSSLDAQTGGYIAYTNDEFKLTVNGVEYVFTAKLLAADQVGLVDWGFGMQEYWKVGATAEHEKTEIDGLFTYEFQPFVVASENKTYKRLAGVKNGAIGMSLTLQSQIGLNLIMNSDLPANVTVKVGEAYLEIITDAETGKRIVTYAVAPTAATENVTFTIVIGENEHKVSVNIENYAKVILKSSAHANAHNLTYAMVEYVRAMNPDAGFLADVSAPAGYENITLTGAASTNTPSLLTSIRFNLDKTIAIEVAGKAEAVGKKVNLLLETGLSVWGTIEEKTVDGNTVYTVCFADLYVNEFFGKMTLKVYDVTGEGENEVKTFIEGEEYTYSLANYLYGISENGATDDDKATVQALYNYAFHADAYVDALPKNA